MRVTVAFLAFAALQGVFALNHELTLDEAHAWNIARLATRPLDVIGIASLEGHTPLWHLVLWPFARSAEPGWMRVVGVGAALVFAAAWLRHAPLPFAVRVLVLFGYFTAFRYPTLVRSYALLLPLLAWLALTVRAGRPRHVLRCAICGTIAMNGAFGVLLSIPLIAIVTVRAFASDGVGRLRLLIGLVGYGAVALAAVAFVVLPLPEASFADQVLAGEMSDDYPVFEPIAQAALPHATDLPFGIGHWSRSATGRTLTGVGSLTVVGAVGILLLPWRAGTLAWFGGVALIWAGSVSAGLVEERYSGHLVLLAVSLWWMRPTGAAFAVEPDSSGAASRRTRPGVGRQAARIVVVPILLWHAAMTAAVGGIDITRTTSTGEQARALIAASHPDAAPPPTVITGQVYDAAAIVALLDRAVFDTDCRCLTRYRADSTIRDTLPAAARIESDWCALIAAGHSVVGLFPDGRHRPDERHELLGTLARSERHSRPVPVYRLRDPASACPTGDVDPDDRAR